MNAANPGTKRRIKNLVFWSCVMIAVLVGRLGWIQLVQGEELRAQALKARTRDLQVEARRGSILDRHLRPLAVSVDVDSIYAVPAEVVDPAATAAALAGILDTTAATLQQRLTLEQPFVWIQRKVDDDKSLQVKELALAGIHFTVESRRYYPKGELAAHLLGFAGLDNQGLEGVELAFDAILRGEPGRIVVEHDARGRQIPEAVHYFVAPVDGQHLVLTLDEVVQYVVEREVRSIVHQHGAKSVLAIALHPPTGDILALSLWPTFDLNAWQEHPADLWRNWAVADTFHPGSVFKPFTAAAAIDLGVCLPDTGFHDPGWLQVPGATISNWDGRGLGNTTLRQGVWHSANVVLAQTALMVGRDGMYRYLEAFGFTRPTGVALPGEAGSLLPTRAEARPVDLAVMSYGQTLQVTAMQMVAAMNSFLTGGVLLQPRVALGYVDDAGEWLEQFPVVEVRQALAAETAGQLVEIMTEVVEVGTGTRAQIAGYSVGGKTGTSQKTIDGVVSKDTYIGSFMGFVPASDPQLLIYIVVKEPEGTPWGGLVGAPAFTRMVDDLVHYLGIEPDRNGDGGQVAAIAELVEVPCLLDLPLDQARQLAQQLELELKIEGLGPMVGGQVPAAGTLVDPGASLTVMTGQLADDQVQPGAVPVPDLTGLSLRRAGELLAAQGLELVFEGSGLVTRQAPAPATLLVRGEAVQIQLASPLEGR